MKRAFKATVIVSALIFSGTLAQAKSCDPELSDPCVEDGYSIVEVEPDTYWPHNQMEAAHWVGYTLHKKVRYRRVRRRSLFSCR